MTTNTPDATPAAQQPTIVLIHGLWLTPLSWEGWQQRFESKGYTVLAPAWPGFEGTVEEVRQNTSKYERLGIKEITDHYDRIIRGLDAPPIIMGHSFGGLITQLLLDRGLGASAVAISPAQIQGVYIVPPAQAKVVSVVLKNPANRHRAQMLTPEEFHYGFTNTRTLEESRPIYDKLAVPGPGRPLFQAAFANFTPHPVTRVNRHNSSRAPLLLLANGKDHTVPAVSTRAAYKIQKKTGALTELKEYPDRSHSTFSQDGWEEVADYSLDWAVRNART
jgi:pimeloyl-ACP methyl ester carboxylesterase